MKYLYNNFYEMLSNSTASTTKYPKNIVIFSENGKINYKNLKQKIYKAISFFKAQKISYVDQIALVVSNCKKFLIYLFAIISIYAIANPINIFLKYYEFNYILNDYKEKMLIVFNSNLKEISNFVSKEKLEKNVNFDEYKKYDIDKSFISSAKLDNIASIIYTLKTTGHLKGAL